MHPILIHETFQKPVSFEPSPPSSASNKSDMSLKTKRKFNEFGSHCASGAYRTDRAMLIKKPFFLQKSRCPRKLRFFNGWVSDASFFDEFIVKHLINELNTLVTEIFGPSTCSYYSSLVDSVLSTTRLPVQISDLVKQYLLFPFPTVFVDAYVPRMRGILRATPNAKCAIFARGPCVRPQKKGQDCLCVNIQADIFCADLIVVTNTYQPTMSLVGYCHSKVGEVFQVYVCTDIYLQTDSWRFAVVPFARNAVVTSAILPRLTLERETLVFQINCE